MYLATFVVTNLCSVLAIFLVYLAKPFFRLLKLRRVLAIFVVYLAKTPQRKQI